MHIDAFFDTIAADWSLDAEALKQYASEDAIGGYSFNEETRECDTGSLWAVDGQALYALVRYLKPQHIVEFGSLFGCSAKHLASALLKNGSGKLTCVDPTPPLLTTFNEALRPMITLVGSTAEHWITEGGLQDVAFIYEDTDHSSAVIDTIWSAAFKALPVGGMIVSHDAEHATAGAEVRKGMTAGAGHRWRSYRIDPADTGLGMWRKS